MGFVLLQYTSEYPYIVCVVCSFIAADLKGELTFAVLWFPSRFPLLALLFIEIVLFILFNVYQFTCSPRR